MSDNLAFAEHETHPNLRGFQRSARNEGCRSLRYGNIGRPFDCETVHWSRMKPADTRSDSPEEKLAIGVDIFSRIQVSNRKGTGRCHQYSFQINECPNTSCKQELAALMNLYNSSMIGTAEGIHLTGECE